MKITATQYANTLYDLTADKSKQEVNNVIANFAKILRKNNQLKRSDKIIAKFNDIYNKENGIIEAEVISAHKLESAQIKKLESYIKEKYSAKEVVIQNKIDEDIKGGIVVKVGDEILDASIAGKLAGLKNVLMK